MTYTVQTYDRAVEYEQMKPDLPEPQNEIVFESLAEAMLRISKDLELDSGIQHRTVGANAIGFYEPGEPWDVLLIEGYEIEPEEPTAASSSKDPRFGEGASGDARADIAVTVRRDLNDYSGLEEVFEFSTVEPSVTQAEIDHRPSVRYYLTKESRNRRPGIKNHEYKSSVIPIQKVPEEVKARAAAMVDFIEFSQDDD